MSQTPGQGGKCRCSLKALQIVVPWYTRDGWQQLQGVAGWQRGQPQPLGVLGQVLREHVGALAFGLWSAQGSTLSFMLLNISMKLLEEIVLQGLGFPRMQMMPSCLSSYTG